MTCARPLVTAALAVGCILSLTHATAPSVSASCAVPLQLARAIATSPVVFVGTVRATRNNSRTATVRVQDVWRGRNVPRIATVYGSYVTGNMVTSVDRSFQVGMKYLFVPEPTRTRSPYQDNDCTPTQRYTKALARYRPKSAHRP